MLKRLASIAVLTAGMFMGLGFVLQDKAEGAYVTHIIRTPSGDIGQNGKTGIRDKEKGFTAGSYDGDQYAKVSMGWIGSGKTTTWAEIFKRKSSYSVKIPWYSLSRKYPHRKGPNNSILPL